MRFKIVGKLPGEIADELRGLGHVARTVADQGMGGAKDNTLLQSVRTEKELFFTLDKGIADIRAYPPEEFVGIVLFRPPSPGRIAALAFVRRFLSDVLDALQPGRLLVVAPSGIRIR